MEQHFGNVGNQNLTPRPVVNKWMVVLIKRLVDNFVSYFKEIYSCNDMSRAQELKNEYSKLRASYSGLPLPRV